MAAEKHFVVTPPGGKWFGVIGLDVTVLRPTRRGLARQCLDWTERRHHFTGPLDVQFMTVLRSFGWQQRSKTSLAIPVTPPGWAGLKKHLGVDESSVISMAAHD